MTQSSTASTAMQAQLNGLRGGTSPNFGPVGRINTVTLASGKTIGIPPHPTGDAHSEASVMMAINALHDLDQAAQGVAGNTRLSDQGKQEELAGKAVHHIKRIAQQWTALDAQESAAQDKEDAHYTPRPLAMGDAAGAAVDSEIRSRFAAMTPDAQAKALAAVRVGNTARVGDALTRDPFGVTEPVTNAWKAGMDVRAPAIRGEIDSEREAVRWARPIMRRVAETAVGISGLKKHDIARALAPSYNGADLFGFSDGEVMAAKSADARSAAQAASSNALATGDA